MIRTTLIYFCVRAVNGILALTTLYVLTRIMPADEYGYYALGAAGIGLSASVFFQWIAVAVSRFYASNAASPNILLSEAFRLFIRIAATALLAAAISAIWPPLPRATPMLAVSVGIGAVAMGWHSLSLQVANAQGNPLRYGALTASRGALTLIGAVMFVYVGWGGVGAVFGMALACFLSALFFGARFENTAHQNAPALRRQMVVYGLPLTLTYLATVILNVSDRFMIAWWTGPSAVAGYAAAYDLTQQIVGTALNVFFLATYPRIIAAWEAGGPAAAHQAMRPLANALLLGTPIVSGIFIGLAPEISRLVLGPTIRTAAEEIMPWVAFAITVGCLKSYFLDIAFQIAKATKIQLRITVLMAVLNVILNLALIPSYGGVGAAISTAAAFTVGAYLSWLFGRRLGVYPATKRHVSSMLFAFVAFVFSARWVSPGDGASEFRELTLRSVVGLTSYALIVLATDLAGVRARLDDRLQKLFARGA